MSLDKHISELLNLCYCPISLEIMKEPVFNKVSGKTYDRKSVEQWILRYENDPLTIQECNIRDLVINYKLRSLIDLLKDHLNLPEKYPY